MLIMGEKQGNSQDVTGWGCGALAQQDEGVSFCCSSLTLFAPAQGIGASSLACAPHVPSLCPCWLGVGDGEALAVK